MATFSGCRVRWLSQFPREGLPKFTNRGVLAQPMILAGQGCKKPKCFICMAFFHFL
jgi:hypothetical protein